MAVADHPYPFVPHLLLKAARRLMRPLVRLMMQSGVTFPILADQLRRMFVQIAVSDILTDPRARTDSRISLLTGVHRKEIRRLRAIPADFDDPPDVVTMASQIVARWAGAARFADAKGLPLGLAKLKAGDRPSFDELVASVTSDIRPRAVLDDLLGQGVVFVDAEDRVQLNTAAFIPRPGGEEQLFYFARNLHDHIAAAAANISGSGVALFLDRSVHYDRLTVVQADSLREYAREVAMRALLDVNLRAQELTAEAPGAETGLDTRRVNFGVFVFDEHEGPAS